MYRVPLSARVGQWRGQAACHAACGGAAHVLLRHADSRMWCESVCCRILLSSATAEGFSVGGKPLVAAACKNGQGSLYQLRQLNHKHCSFAASQVRSCYMPHSHFLHCCSRTSGSVDLFSEALQGNQQEREVQSVPQPGACSQVVLIPTADDPAWRQPLELALALQAVQGLLTAIIGGDGAHSRIPPLPLPDCRATLSITALKCTLAAASAFAAAAAAACPLGAAYTTRW